MSEREAMEFASKKYRELVDDAKLRRWAVEQAVACKWLPPGNADGIVDAAEVIRLYALYGGDEALKP